MIYRNCLVACEINGWIMKQPVFPRSLKRPSYCASGLVLGVLLSILGSFTPMAVYASGTNDGPDPLCTKMMSDQIELCAQRIERFPNGGSQWIRIHLFESYTGAQPHNEYFVWQTCGETEYRIVTREPNHLPTIQRTKTVDAKGDSELHRTLRFFGRAACEVTA